MPSAPQSVLKKDPVCGMSVDPATAKATAEYGGETYYFCCAGCAQKFQANPEQFLKPESIGLVTLGSPTQAQLVSPQKEAGAYVCPMCPEVREPKAGPCPKCGMALEQE